MVLKGLLFVLALMAVLISIGAVFFSLDSLATARDDAPAATVAESSAQQAQDHGDHNTALPLESFAGQVSEDAEQVA